MISLWWAGLSVAMKIVWGITLAATFVFVIQSIMTFIGASGDIDIDSDIDFDGLDADVPDAIAGGSDMNLYTFRNFINFIIGSGWSLILLKDSIASRPLLILVSAVVGIALVAAVMYIFKFLASMQQSGNINVRNSAVGCQGTVYLTIPGERAGRGKVQITINGAVREFDAVTDSSTLQTGAQVKVTEVLGQNTLVVEEIESLIV